MQAVIMYDGKPLISCSADSFGDTLGTPEEWADLYAAESGLDREMDYDPALLEVVFE